MIDAPEPAFDDSSKTAASHASVSLYFFVEKVHMNQQQKRKHDELPISERRKTPCVTVQDPKPVPGRTLQAIKREEEARKR